MAIKCKYNWHNTGHQVFYDGSTFETLHTSYPIQFYDDFLGADVVIPAMGSDESGCKWVQKDVSAVGTVTIGRSADATNGVISLDLDTQAEVQSAWVTMDDELGFSIAQGLIFEARITMSVLPSGAAARGIFGMGGAYVAGGPAHRVGFEILTAGTINAEEDDAATDTSADTGITAVAGTYNIFRIDCTTQTDIKFFIDGVRVAAGTTFNNASTGANLKMQPYFGCDKTADAAQATMLCDYIKIYQNRS
jgi:hypothetical protein